jgi:hypothetical protein
VQTPFSTSQVRTVESQPQLTALPSPSNVAFETLAVWLLRTFKGAFLLTALSSVTLRRFFRSTPRFSRGTSSEVGTMVSQNPMSPSQEAVRRCVPAGEAVTLAIGAVCRWRLASGVVWARPGLERESRVSFAVRSCDAEASKWLLEVGLEVGTRHREVIGA